MQCKQISRHTNGTYDNDIDKYKLEIKKKDVLIEELQKRYTDAVNTNQSLREVVRNRGFANS